MANFWGQKKKNQAFGKLTALVEINLHLLQRNSKKLDSCSIHLLPQPGQHLLVSRLGEAP
jgi:hypothetical protein